MMLNGALQEVEHATFLLQETRVLGMSNQINPQKKIATKKKDTN